MGRLVLDLSREASICGDIASHVLDLLEEARPGDEIEVRTRLPRDVVEDSLSLLVATGRVEVVEEREEDGVLVVVLRVKEA